MRTSRVLPVAMAVVVALSFQPVDAAAQDAADLMRQAVAAQTERLAGVEDVTIVQEVMGMEMAVYMEKREVGGVPTLMPVSVTLAGMTNAVPQDQAQADWANPFQEEWISRTRLEGKETLNGRTVLVFAIDDFTDLTIPGMPGGGGGAQDLQPKSFRFSLDEDGLYMRQAEMEGEALQDDGTRSPVQMTMVMDDYRETSGYLHPWLTSVKTEGMMEASDIDQAEVEAQLAEIRAQMADLPEAQRAMMEGMMGAQIERLEEMLGGDGAVEMTMTVREVKVNAGPPGGGV